MTTAKAKDGHGAMSHIADELERVPERVEDARKALEGWEVDLEKMVKKNPIRTLLGAFAVGFLVSKIVRHI